MNDRGLPLTDSDIFKGEIYKSKKNDEEAQQEFIENWKELNKLAEEANIRGDDVFKYYHHIIRTREGLVTKEIGLRKFYEGKDKKLNSNDEKLNSNDEKYKRLKEANLMKDLLDLAEFWRAIYKRDSLVADKDLINEEAKKYLHCLLNYPNEYWKYIVSVFYYANKNDKDFADEFTKFLEKLTAFLFVKFIYFPTVNKIKDDIYKACIAIRDGKPSEKLFVFNVPDEFSIENLKVRLPNVINFKIAKALILLHSYLNEEQKYLLPSDFQVEHILPRKWQKAHQDGWNKEDVAEYLERFGNKVAIEPTINKSAGDNGFAVKKSHYKKSDISEVKDLLNYKKNNWSKKDIEVRETEFVERISKFFQDNLSTKQG